MGPPKIAATFSPAADLEEVEPEEEEPEEDEPEVSPVEAELLPHPNRRLAIMAPASNTLKTFFFFIVKPSLLFIRRLCVGSHGRKIGRKSLTPQKRKGARGVLANSVSAFARLLLCFDNRIIRTKTFHVKGI